MTRITFLLLAVCVVLMAQTPGTITTKPGVPPQPAQPAELVATSGAISCAFRGDTFPATKVTIACVVRGVVIGPEVYAPAPKDAYMFTRTLASGDSVAATIRADTVGKITIEAAANTSPATTWTF